MPSPIARRIPSPSPHSTVLPVLVRSLIGGAGAPEADVIAAVTAALKDSFGGLGLMQSVDGTLSSVVYEIGHWPFSQSDHDVPALANVATAERHCLLRFL